MPKYISGSTCVRVGARTHARTYALSGLWYSIGRHLQICRQPGVLSDSCDTLDCSLTGVSGCDITDDALDTRFGLSRGIEQYQAHRHIIMPV
jgi:hypothetical protein